MFWFHAMLGHPGSRCMHAMLQAWSHHPHLCLYIEKFACNRCQYAKPSGSSHGLRPDWNIYGAHWEEVVVDLIGIWPASTSHDIMEFFALTCIGTTTNLVEIAWIFEESSNHIATRFEHTWLSVYHNQCQSSMIIGDSSQGFVSNNCYDCYTLNQFQPQTRTHRLMLLANACIRLLHLC